jgi:hypothetical protein
MFGPSLPSTGYLPTLAGRYSLSVFMTVITKGLSSNQIRNNQLGILLTGTISLVEFGNVAEILVPTCGVAPVVLESYRSD